MVAIIFSFGLDGGVLNTWGPFLYQYGIGSLIFLVTMIIVVRSGALDLSANRDRWLFRHWLQALLAFV